MLRGRVDLAEELALLFGRLDLPHDASEPLEHRSPGVFFAARFAGLQR
jgi:hypothetical protein